MHKNQAANDRRHREKRKAKGEVRVAVWIPEHRREELVKLAEKWRTEDEG